MGRSPAISVARQNAQRSTPIAALAVPKSPQSTRCTPRPQPPTHIVFPNFGARPKA